MIDPETGENWLTTDELAAKFWPHAKFPQIYDQLKAWRDAGYFVEGRNCRSDRTTDGGNLPVWRYKEKSFAKLVVRFHTAYPCRMIWIWRFKELQNTLTASATEDYATN